MINSLLNEGLYKLEFEYIISPEVAKAVRESCPNLQFLRIFIGVPHMKRSGMWGIVMG